MNLQGTPIGNTSTGQKNTTDPKRYNNPVTEGSGPVTSDSLAADSVRQGGAFSQNRDSEPLGVSGDQSTFTNTNTSSATTLPSSENATNRQDPNEQERYPDALGGQGEYPGPHVPTTGYVGGSNQAKKDLGIQGHQYNTQQRPAEAGSSTPKSRYYGGPAATYGLSVVGQLGDFKPKGNDIKEGGFENKDSINASFNSDIGTQKDPGRASENQFQRHNATSGLDVGHPRQRGLEQNAQPYGNLKRNQNA